MTRLLRDQTTLGREERPTTDFIVVYEYSEEDPNRSYLGKCVLLQLDLSNETREYLNKDSIH